MDVQGAWQTSCVRVCNSGYSSWHVMELRATVGPCCLDRRIWYHLDINQAVYSSCKTFFCSLYFCFFKKSWLLSRCVFFKHFYRSLVWSSSLILRLLVPIKCFIVCVLFPIHSIFSSKTIFIICFFVYFRYSSDYFSLFPFFLVPFIFFILFSFCSPSSIISFFFFNVIKSILLLFVFIFSPGLFVYIVWQ